MSLPNRLLALDIRGSRLGFVVLEGEQRLLDWGVRSFGDQNKRFISAASDRVATLLTFYKPAAVVVRARKYHSSFRNNRFQAVAASIKSQTMRNSAKFFALTSRQVQGLFQRNGQNTKHEIAASLANKFEELSWKLPVRRKSYQSEPSAMLMFDALATGVAFIRRRTSATFDIARGL